MLLGSKKTQSEEKNWCIVLNPLQSELDKKKISQTISQVFALSSEEAFDLVSNTPIILLDNLTRTMAIKVKDFFQLAGADMTLTNDVLIKRKCYRTVWPEPPSLSFLHDWKAPEKLQKKEEIMNAEEVLQEIRTLSTPGLEFSDEEKGKLQREIERWQQECAKLREDSVRLRHELETVQGSRSGNGEVSEEYKIRLGEREDEVRELRALLGNAGEKYEILKEEYRQARDLFEEKLAIQKTGDSELLAKVKALERKLQMLEVEKTRMLQEKRESDKATTELRQAYENQEKVFHTHMKQSESKEEEFRLLREHVEHLERELRDRDAEEKQHVAMRELQEKERLLKELVKEQQVIEAEIRSREESIRQILSRQEVIEKGILEAHETHRNLTGPKVISPAEDSNGSDHA